eukprot:TRINITY_DN3998_c0_g8_i1.p1 TRINITY_DN3998_c0_g8~~TRINITY_DN3998_c0_g8_i1.p1  ORF type:complete len:180 (+),score=24.02 TRINITY_DN3998_c0_g8_i1:78-542(+)
METQSQYVDSRVVKAVRQLKSSGKAKLKTQATDSGERTETADTSNSKKLFKVSKKSVPTHSQPIPEGTAFSIFKEKASLTAKQSPKVAELLNSHQIDLDSIFKELEKDKVYPSRKGYVSSSGCIESAVFAGEFKEVGSLLACTNAKKDCCDKCG